MSGPNSSYDPVEVTPLRADQVEEMREQAFAAIAAAEDLAALKQVRIDHAGDRSPLALANREIGALPPQAKKEAGQRVGQARAAVQQALAARQADLEVEAEARMLVEETVDVTLPTARRPAGSRHPLTMLAEDIADVFLALGSVKGKYDGRNRVVIPSPNIAVAKWSSVPLRWAKVMPSSTTRPSTWWKTGECVASYSSVR